MDQSSSANGTAQIDSADIRAILANLEQRQARLEESVGVIRQLVEAQQIEKEWYSTGELAEIMGVKQYTVQERWCNQGRIKCVKDDNGKWRIPGDEVRRLRRGESLASATSD